MLKMWHLRRGKIFVLLNVICYFILRSIYQALVTIITFLVLASFPGQRQDTHVYHAFTGFYYHCSHITGDVVYFKCSSYGRGCRARAILYLNNEFVETQEHGHDANYDLWRVMRLRYNILRSVEYEPHLTFRDIVYREGRRFPMHIRGQVPPNTMRNSMERVRNAMYPHVPQTLHELSTYIQDPFYAFLTRCEDSEDSLTAAEIEDADGYTHIILISQRMMSVMEQVQWLFGDGHFASRPVGPQLSQIFNLVCLWDNHVIFLGCILMESRTEVAYRSVFAALRRLMPNLDPQYIACDHEIVQQAGWSWAFPRSVIVGCLWHFCRAVVRHALSLGLGSMIRRSRRWRRLLRMCCTLPLFPNNMMLNWINNPARNFSVFECDSRTSNVVECVNRWMRHEVGPHHPNPYMFLNAVIRMEGISWAAVTALRGGTQPARSRRSSAVSNDARIRTLSRHLRQHPLGIREAVRNLLLYGSNTFRRAFNDMVNVEEVNEFD